MRRSTPHFFHDPDTHVLIENVARLASVLLYAGAGVSIDRVGLDWKGLADKLLVNHVRDKHEREALIELFGPLPASSVAHEYYGGVDDEPARAAIVSALRVFLYEGREWSGGRLTRNMSRFLVASPIRERYPDERRGALTTNFDDFLERDLQDEAALANTPTEFARFFSPQAIAGQSPHQVSCSYLHGYIPDRARPEDKRGEDQAVIVSECDYYDSRRNQSFEDLAAAIQDTNLVIVGSSMSDPPLLRALAETRNDKFERYAMLPLQQWQYDESNRKHLIEFVTTRLSHLGVKPIFPDFFAQIAQFFRETLTCAETGSGSYSAEDSHVRYGHRVNQWWDSWYRAAAPDIRTIQHDDHRRLAEKLEGIRETLEASKNEDLKLEVWLRWNTPEQRQLRLWAASVGNWHDVPSMRTAEIEPDCPYASVQAFCSGRPMLLPGTGDVATRRWEAYFAVPVWWQDPDGEFPVGVVSLASSRTLEDGSISERKAACWIRYGSSWRTSVARS